MTGYGEYYERPSRFENDEHRGERIAAGVALCRAALAAARRRGTAPGDDGLTPAHRAARDRARRERRTRTTTPAAKEQR